MLAAIIAIFAIIADQITKYIVVQNIELHDKIPFIKGFMSFYHTRNTGGGWSILDGGGSERVVLITVSLLAMGLVVFVLAKNYHRHMLMNISLAMVLGGGIGNMIDRIRLQYVVDFLHTEFIDFPTFNIADCFISVGAVLLIIYVLFYDSKVEKRLAEEKAANEALIGAENAEPQGEEIEEAETTQENTEEKGENE
ncbi:MAG: signal peptidase II [Ruminococcaceae bacterium]|nr:signal peptidase II [Oscillospiraceae bacterium]